ncbi:MAG: hypothetical protein EZS28_056165, partial [Streblomastix strix]
EEEKKKIEEQQNAANLLRSNPLLQPKSEESNSFNVRPRWDEDVVFRNQARGDDDGQKRFINDTTRNDFHRKFLKKYIK